MIEYDEEGRELGQYIKDDPRIGRRVKWNKNPTVLVITDILRWSDGTEKYCTKLVGVNEVPINRGSGMVAAASMFEFIESEQPS
jgi:hypothetical protein